MAGRFLQTLFTPEVRAEQSRYFGRSREISGQPERNPLTAEESEFIAQRDSFYLSTVTSDGWPYLQHRGGPRGFLKVLDASTLGFADYSGNRQLISTGNVAGNDRVALFLMDYPRRERLKILGHARVLDARGHPDIAARVADPELLPDTERVFLIDVLSFDWNCPQYITPRFTADEIQGLVQPLRDRIAELEARLASG
jgi:predicted pyridoxine 5'-phosphate oxidase superfamily flavin-nucleotide-binding protein